MAKIVQLYRLENEHDINEQNNFKLKNLNSLKVANISDKHSSRDERFDENTEIGNDQLWSKIKENNPGKDFQMQEALKKEKMYLRISKILSSSSAHGIPNLIKTENFFMQIMWTILFIGATCTGSYYTIDSILDYFKNHTVTKIDVVNVEQSKFPTVSFCGSPLFNTSLEKIVKSVRFEKIYESNLSHIFEEFNDTVYGKCFRYNSGTNMYGEKYNFTKTAVIGKRNNLRISFYLDYSNKSNFNELLIQIHNHTLPPYDMEIGGYWVKSGSMNYFQVKRIFTIQLGEPYNNCMKDINEFKQNKTIIENLHI